MALHVPSPNDSSHDSHLGSDFVDRLGAALEGADRARRRRAWLIRAQRVLPLVLLIGPIFGWRLMQTSPDGAQIAIAAISWVAFLLDVAVHADTSLLGSLGLQWLPTVIGLLLFVLVAVTLLWEREP